MKFLNDFFDRNMWPFLADFFNDTHDFLISRDQRIFIEEPSCIPSIFKLVDDLFF